MFNDGVPASEIDSKGFAENMVKFQESTGATEVIVCYNEYPRKVLRKGLSYAEFIEKLEEKLSLSNDQLSKQVLSHLHHQALT